MRAVLNGIGLTLVAAGISVLHQIWRRLPAAPRRRLATRFAALVAPRPSVLVNESADGIIVGGELTRASGLGESARLMLRGLAALGVPAWPLDIGRYLPAHQDDLRPPLAPSATPPSNAPLILHVNPPMLPLVLARLPRFFVQSRRIVGYWYWELPVSPSAWEVSTKFVHAVWAPSRFTANALADLVDGPICVVRPPAAICPRVPAPVGRVEFGFPEHALIVLASFNLASSFVRKNPLGTVEAFRMAFGTRKDRILVLKVVNSSHFPDDFAQLAAAVRGAENIRLITETLSPEVSSALTSAADIVMSLHRSEGFGLVAAEGMLLGKPVIATNWSATTEFMDETCAALVRSHLVPTVDPRRIYDVRNAMWAEPDLEHAAEWLQRLADSPELRRTFGEAAYAEASARLGTTTLANAVNDLGVRMANVLEDAPAFGLG